VAMAIAVFCLRSRLCPSLDVSLTHCCLGRSDVYWWCLELVLYFL
jgi:hypothetical protein